MSRFRFKLTRRRKNLGDVILNQLLTVVILNCFCLRAMKLTHLLIITSSFLCASAFGVSARPSLSIQQQRTRSVLKPAFHKDVASVNSPSLRNNNELVRGGAVPGWAAYNEALDKKPLITKAMTSLVGWALGDILVQVQMLV